MIELTVPHVRIAGLVERHVAVASVGCPSMAAKAVTPHTLRHSSAMNLLRHGVDVATIALWLGHEDVRTTYSVYLHADLGLKEKAIAKTAPPNSRPGRYRPSDNLLAFLEGL
jgi:site-specific recombinase XerD